MTAKVATPARAMLRSASRRSGYICRHCRGGSNGGTNADLPADLRIPAGETGEMLVATKDGPIAAQSSSIVEQEAAG
jgi:hypothetical protein